MAAQLPVVAMSCTFSCVCFSFIIYWLRVFPGLFMNIEATFQPQPQSQSQFLSRSRSHGSNPPTKTDTKDNTRGTPRASCICPLFPHLSVPPTIWYAFACVAYAATLPTLLTEAHSACSVVYRPVVKHGLKRYSWPYRKHPISLTLQTYDLRLDESKTRGISNLPPSCGNFPKLWHFSIIDNRSFFRE